MNHQISEIKQKKIRTSEMKFSRIVFVEFFKKLIKYLPTTSSWGTFLTPNRNTQKIRERKCKGHSVRVSGIVGSIFIKTRPTYVVSYYSNNHWLGTTLGWVTWILVQSVFRLYRYSTSIIITSPVSYNKYITNAFKKSPPL